MRLLVDYRPALRGRSGVGEYAYQLIRALLSQNASAGNGVQIDVTMFSSSWKDRLQVPPELGGATPIDRRVPVSILNYAWHRWEWPPAELLTGSRFDVTHSLHPLLMPSRHAAHVVTIHDLNFLTHPERTRAEIRRDYPALVRSHAHRADAVIVPSHFTASEVEHRLDLPPDRIAVCSPGAPEWSARGNPPADGYVLFLGTLEPRKNVGVLLDAYERLLGRGRDVPDLVLAGGITEQSHPWLERLRTPALAGRARHVGYVDPAARKALYEGARLLVQPSHEEGFGIPVLEAMTLGVPVVAANRGALPEVLGDAGLLADADDPEAFAATIARVLDEEGLAAASAARGVARSHQFRWADTASRALDVYRLALRRRAERHGEN